MSRPLTVALDYRPALIIPHTGIGRYVRNLVPSMLEADPHVRLKLYGVFFRGHSELCRNHAFPPVDRASFHGAAFPSRLMSCLARVLPISAATFCGTFDLFHDTDYAVTPVRRRPRVATLYDTAYLLEKGFVSPEQSTRMRSVVENLISGVTRLITISEFARDELVEAYALDPETISVTYLGVDPVFLEEDTPGQIEETRSRWDLEPPYCIYVGTLEPRKNLVRLVKAFARLLEIEPEQQLVLVGRKGWGYERVFEVARSLEVQDRVRWLGTLSDRETALLMKGAEMLAYPSLYEGFGLPALEGMAAGVPVLAADSHALREICGDGALLVDPHDELEIFEGLRTLALDRGEALDIAERGRRRAEAFTWSRCARQTLEAYREAQEQTA